MSVLERPGTGAPACHRGSHRARTATAAAVLAVVTLALAGACSKDDPTSTATPTTVGTTIAPATTAPPGTTAGSTPGTTATTATTAPPTTRPPTTPSSVGTQIESVDFGDLTLGSQACGEFYANPPPGGYPLHGGEARLGNPGDAGFYAVQLRPNPTFGDLDGDGLEDAVLVVDCSSGSSPRSFASAYRLDTSAGPSSSPVALMGPLALDQATATRLDSFGDPRLTGVSLDGSTVVTTWATHRPGDPICCPTGEATVHFSWSGSGFAPSA
jgi:hypothetical protein